MDFNKLADLLFPDVTETPADMEAKYPPRNLPEGVKVTRFAPSPTGYVHFGGLFPVTVGERLAHQSGGVFYLRIEDTDAKREVPGAAEGLITTLAQYGIHFDEGAILDESGCVLAAADPSSMFVVGDTVYLTPNILSVMNGGSGAQQRAGAECFDFCIRIASGEEAYLIYVRDSKEEMQSLNWMLFSIILQALLFGGVFAIVLSFFLAKTITSPIQSLTRGAQQIAAGEFEQEIDVHSRDEIGTLTDTFNHMKSVLKNTIDQVSGEQKKLETVFFYLKDAVAAFRDDGTLMHQNTTAKDLFAMIEGRSRDTGEETEDTSLTLAWVLKLCGIEDNPVFRAALERNDEPGEEGYVIREIALCERVFDVSLGNFRYMEDNENHTGIIAVIHDVTGRYELDRSRREFVANVSHELRP